jgi:hypothetical protein
VDLYDLFDTHNRRHRSVSPRLWNLLHYDRKSRYLRRPIAASWAANAAGWRDVATSRYSIFGGADASTGIEAKFQNSKQD